MFNRAIQVTCFLYLFFIFSWYPSYTHGQSLLAKEKTSAIKDSIVGEWVADVGKNKLTLRLTREGTFLISGKAGEYSFEGNNIRLKSQTEEVGYQFEVSQDFLTLSGADLGQALKFSRKSEFTGYVGRLFHFSIESATLKIQRILVIGGIMISSGLLILLLKLFSQFLIYSDWGPLRLIYTQHKNRLKTIHSLLLNLFKYIIYFTAIGFILAELGFNYKAYLASLSVIGLAIGFGAQGLVQDVVTGFFLIFEGQFEVGDMVEISGQTGIVEEMGLRVTKIRSYFGQLITAQNRNIAVVGNYTKGALQVYIDVAVASPEAAEQSADELLNISAEISRQFDGIILKTPEILEPVSLETGEHFVRIEMKIWPQQQWVIDQQLVPRIREIFKSKGIDIPGDRIVTFYRLREERPVKEGWWRYLKKEEKSVN